MKKKKSYLRYFIHTVHAPELQTLNLHYCYFYSFFPIHIINVRTEFLAAFYKKKKHNHQF